MSMRTRYSGEFLSLSGVTWRADILQEADTDFTVGELVFPIDPLTIEWESRSPEQSLCGSMATLRIESPGDRTYADLYTETPGAVRLDIYRDDVLYWSGGLDTEAYMEPYDRGSLYDVELTFYDFGHLGRIPYALTGQKTLLQVVQAALSAAGISYTAIDESYVSTKFTDNTAVTLSALSVMSENFIDEDGVAFDYERVLEGILQPLGLRLIQKAGKVWVYDINGLYTLKATTEDVVWDGTGQMLDVGRVYNNLRVTFSPYSSALLLKDFKYGDVYGPEYINLTSTGGNPECYSYYTDYDESHRHSGSWDYNLVSFTTFLSSDSTKCKGGLASKGTDNRYFKIYPNLGGEESEGVAVGFYTGGHGPLTSGWPVRKGINPAGHPQTVAMTTERVYLPPISSEDQKNNFVRILMEVLADCRYNPFEDAPEDGDGNENDNYNEMKAWAQQAFVPVTITLYDASGTALYHYDNSMITALGHPANSIADCASTQNGDGWVAGAASFGDAWLAFYDSNLDIIEGNGIFGWKANRQNFGKPWSEGRRVSNRRIYYFDLVNGVPTIKDWWCYDSFKKAPDGQFIPYPPAGGYLEVKVYNGIYIFDDRDTFADDASGGFYDEGMYDKLRWLLYKVPQISVVRRTLTFDDAEVDDMEYSGVCNPAAQEELSIDTICGTLPSVCPTARGLYLRTSNGQQVSQFKRAGRTESAEQLLIGTLYSQFATRKTALSGEVVLDPGGVTLYEDAAQPSGTKLLMTGETQHLREDMSEAGFLEVRPDEYTAE